MENGIHRWLNENKQSKRAIMRGAYLLLPFYALMPIRSSAYEIVRQIKSTSPVFHFQIHIAISISCL